MALFHGQKKWLLLGSCSHPTGFLTPRVEPPLSETSPRNIDTTHSPVRPQEMRRNSTDWHWPMLVPLSKKWLEPEFAFTNFTLKKKTVKKSQFEWVRHEAWFLTFLSNPNTFLIFPILHPKKKKQQNSQRFPNGFRDLLLETPTSHLGGGMLMGVIRALRVVDLYPTCPLPKATPPPPVITHSASG